MVVGSYLEEATGVKSTDCQNLTLAPLRVLHRVSVHPGERSCQGSVRAGDVLI